MGLEEIQAKAEAIAVAEDRDVLFYSGPIGRPLDDQIIRMCRQRRRRPNLLVILVTEGGDGDSAFRIARCLQKNYEHIRFFVTGYCKSAGTLVAVGAHELVFSEHGELGPLDIQMRKADDWESTSGLTVTSSLQAMQTQAQMMFRRTVLEIQKMDLFSAKLSSEIATKLTVGALQPVFEQVEAMHIGEADRAQQIADYYGKRLDCVSDNLQDDGLERLLADYPDHGYVIDLDEATELFRNVRVANDAERALSEEMGWEAIIPVPAEYHEPDVRFLSEEVPSENATEEPHASGEERENAGDVGSPSSGNGAPLAAPRG